MATRGARPKPTALKVLQGTDRADRRNEHEPQTTAAIPACPDHLSGEAKSEWERVGRLLAGLGLVTQIDRAALAAYCQAWGRWVEAEEAIKRHGVVIKSPNNFPIQSPYLAIANKAMDQMRLLLAEFGMTPSSRTRVTASPTTAAGLTTEDLEVELWLRQVARDERRANR
jgi:P27 family predicted phage terminase small subunit